MKDEKIKQFDEIFETLYLLSTGAYDPDKLKDGKKIAGYFARDEVWSEGGACYEIMGEINNISNKLDLIEDEHGKYNPEYDPDDNLVSNLVHSYDDYCKGLCKVMFEHGIRLGNFSNKILECIFELDE